MPVKPWNELRISPSKIGMLCDPNFCPLCYWRLLRLKFKKPYTFPMPAILQKMDKQQKNLVTATLANKKPLPKYFGPFCDSVRALDHDSVSGLHEPTGLTLYGKPDLVLANENGEVSIIDNKTAKVKEYDHPLAANYRAQVNFYGYVLENSEYQYTIDKLAILYYEMSVAEDDEVLKLVNDDCMMARLMPTLVEVEYDPESILEPLFETVRELIDAKQPPAGAEGCQDCEKLAAFHECAELADSRVLPPRNSCRDEQERYYRQRYLVDVGLTDEKQYKLDHLAIDAAPDGVLAQWLADEISS